VERGSDNRLPVHILSLKLLELRNEKKEVQQWGTRVRRESTIKEIKVKYEKQTSMKLQSQNAHFVLTFTQELNLAQLKLA
jgi:hypothetical protein